MATSGGGNRRGGAHGGRGRRPQGSLAVKGVAVDESDRIEVPWWLSGTCPGPNVMAEFLEKRLPPGHHYRVLDHIKDCEPCWDLFSSIAQCLFNLDALDLGDEVVAEVEAAAPASRPKPPASDLPAIEAEPLTPVKQPQPVASSRRRRPHELRLAARIATYVAVAGVALAIGWWLPSRDPRALLTATVPSERPFAARVTGGIPWSPHAQRVRSAAVDGGLELTRGVVSYLAAAELRSERDGATSSDELGAVGAAQLLGGRAEPAVETLTRAVAGEPDSPELLSDYGAALLARAEGTTDLDFDEEPRPGREERDADLPAALEAIERALERSPRLPEALFNRALALERLHLAATAKKAWERYLEADGRSAWAKEARGRLAAIELPVIADAAQLRAEIATAAFGDDPEKLATVVHEQRHLARRTVEEDLLPSWGAAVLAGSPSDASTSLAAARALAEEWERQTTDASLLAAVGEIEAASGQSREQLAEAYGSIGESARALLVFDLAKARATADRALALLPPASPAAPWARTLRLSPVFYESGDVEGEAELLLRDPRTDIASRGRALWAVGLWRCKRGDAPRAIASYREALADYARLDEREPTVWLHQLVGEAYGYMGASGLGWQHRRAAMRNVGLLTDRKQAFIAFLASAMVAFAEQFPRVAADFLSESLAVPGEREPYEAVQAFLFRSRIGYALGDSRGANADFVRATAWLPRLGTIDTRWAAPEANAIRGQLARDPTVAIAALSRAIAQFQEVGQLSRVPGVLLARAEVHARTGHLDEADRDLQQAAVVNEQHRGTDFQQLLRTAPLDNLDRLFDERVDLALRGGRAADAFAIAEATRARALRVVPKAADATRVPPPDSLRLAGLRSRLEPGTTMLFFAVLQERVVRWQIDNRHSSLVTLSISPVELRRTTSALAADLQAGAWTSNTREAAMRLHAALIGRAVRGPGLLVIVPDDELHRLPFAVLVDPETRRFLVEDRAVVIAPSATAFVAARDRSRVLSLGPPADAVVVGDPYVSPTLFPGLQPLAGARDEARAVAALYPQRDLLLGGAATRRAFVASLGQHQVVHFAGHAVINRANPELSSLPLADDDVRGGSSVLFGTDIADFDLARTRAVVLSGCETAAGTVVGGEGPVSLARAFLAAGVPSVVASLWSIADEPSAPLVTAFHRGLRKGEQPAAALRAAQLSALHGADREQRSPSVWASFQAFGG